MEVDPEELERRGLYDPGAPGAEGDLAMMTRLVGLGATWDQIAESRGDLGGLAADLALRPGERTYTLAGAAAGVGLKRADAERAWRALGLALPDDRNPSLTVDEAEVLAFFADAAELLGPDGALQLFRTTGAALRAIADTEVAALRLNVEIPRQRAGDELVDIHEGYRVMSEELLPQIERVHRTVHRAHLVASGYERWDVDEELSTTTAHVTVGFADLVGFTELARSVTVAELAASTTAFEDQVAALVSSHESRLVKLIGDEVMFVAESPARACRLALDLTEAFSDHPSLPPIRVGLAAGAVATRGGDYHGPVVNIAHRLVELADPGTIVVDPAVRDGAEEAFAFTELEPARVKGYDDPIEAWSLIAPL